MCKPMYEIKVKPKNNTIPFAALGMSGGYQFEVWLDGRLIGLSKFEFIGTAQAKKAAETFCNYFFDVR